MVSLNEKTLLTELRDSLDVKFANDFEDYILLAFLRACKKDLNRAVQMFNKAIEVGCNLSGRKDQRVDFTKHQSLKEISNDIVYKYLGTGYDGSPVFWIPLGRYNAKSHIEKGLAKEFWLHSFKCIHEGFHKLYEIGEKTGVHQKAVLIVDLKDLSFSKLTNYELIQGCLNNFRDFQSMANLIDKVYLVNGNWVANYVLKVAQPFMKRKTSSKIERLHITDIREVFSEDILPREYGGTGIRINA